MHTRMVIIRQIVTNADNDVEKQEPSYMVCGNIIWRTVNFSKS